MPMRVCEVHAQMITDPRPLKVDDHGLLQFILTPRTGLEGFISAWSFDTLRTFM
jgi:hypothetical protein